MLFRSADGSAAMMDVDVGTNDAMMVVAIGDVDGAAAAVAAAAAANAAAGRGLVGHVVVVDVSVVAEGKMGHC